MAEATSAIVFNEFQHHLTRIEFPSDEDNIFWHSENCYRCFSRLVSDCTCHRADSLSQSPPIALSPLERSCKCIFLSEDRRSCALFHLCHQACVSIRRTNSSFSQVNTQQKLVIWCCSSLRDMSAEKCKLTHAKSSK